MSKKSKRPKPERSRAQAEPGREAAPAIMSVKPTADVPRSRGAGYLGWLAALLSFWCFGFTTMMGSDLWWHLASGRWIWQNKTLDFKDPWSFTAFGKTWNNHEWLSDVVFWGWSSALGTETLVWWKWGILTAAFLVLFGVLAKLARSWLAAFASALLAISVGAAFFDVRPQLYSLLGFAVVLRVALLESRMRWVLPFVFLVWVNLHGGFFFGLLALTTILAVAWLVGQAPRNSLPLWLCCVVVCLVNPNGPDAFLFPLHYALHGKSPYLRVGEWHAPWEAGGIRSSLYVPAIGVFLAATAAAFALKLHRKQPRLTYTGLALAVLTLAMSLKSRRFISLFGMAQSLVLAPVLAAALVAARDRLRVRFAGRRLWGALPFVGPVCGIVLAAAWLSRYPLSRDAFLYLTSEDSFPVEAVNVIEANRLSGKVFAYYQWGGYLNLRTDGRMKVYIDGRADTVFDETTYVRYTRVLNAARGWESIVDSSGADYVLWPRRDKQQVDGLRSTGDWRMLYWDRTAALLVRKDFPVPEPLTPSPESPWRQVALGWRATAAKDLSSAEQHFVRALEMKPNLRLACEWLANTQAKTNRWSEAEATLDRCQRGFPSGARKQELMTYFRTRADAM